MILPHEPFTSVTFTTVPLSSCPTIAADVEALALTLSGIFDVSDVWTVYTPGKKDDGVSGVSVEPLDSFSA